VDDVIELGLVGIVALREDRKTVIIWSVSKSGPFTLNCPLRDIAQALNLHCLNLH
jgi:hypothetical protein